MNPEHAIQTALNVLRQTFGYVAFRPNQWVWGRVLFRGFGVGSDPPPV